MASYTDSQLNRLADRLRDGQDLTTQECINLVGDCQRLAVDLINMTEERDTLRAELATVKAALPRWRKDKLGLRLGYGTGDFVAAINQQHTGLWSVHTMVVCGRLFPSRDAAMAAVTEALGLPPCEVCDA
jgi:hypothetical protein